MHLSMLSPTPPVRGKVGVSGGLALKTRPRGGALDFPFNITTIMAKKVLVQFKKAIVGLLAV